MRKIEYFRDQAERAERLAKAIMDTLTVGTLRALAAECGSQAEPRSAETKGSAAA